MAICFRPITLIENDPDTPYKDCIKAIHFEVDAELIDRATTLLNELYSTSIVDPTQFPCDSCLPYRPRYGTSYHGATPPYPSNDLPPRYLYVYGNTGQNPMARYPH